ncbi:MAG: helix-turn-helix transcriptional regulator [Methanobacterium sp.]
MWNGWALTTHLPETGFLRLTQIIGNRKTNIPAVIPISRTSFLNGVKSGIYPQPVKLGERTTAWKVQDIRDLIERLNNYNPTPKK